MLGKDRNGEDYEKTVGIGNLREVEEGERRINIQYLITPFSIKLTKGWHLINSPPNSKPLA